MSEKPLLPQASLMDVARAIELSCRRMTVVAEEDSQLLVTLTVSLILFMIYSLTLIADTIK